MYGAQHLISQPA